MTASVSPVRTLAKTGQPVSAAPLAGQLEVLADRVHASLDALRTARRKLQRREFAGPYLTAARQHLYGVQRDLIAITPSAWSVERAPANRGVDDLIEGLELAENRLRVSIKGARLGGACHSQRSEAIQALQGIERDVRNLHTLPIRSLRKLAAKRGER